MDPQKPINKFINTDSFESEQFKSVPEVFICYGYEEIFEFEQNRPEGSKEYFEPTEDFIATRKKLRGRVGYLATENQKDI